MNFSIREIQESDIPFLASYWTALTPEDLKRMSIDPQLLPKTEELKSRLLTVIEVPPIDRQVDPIIWEVDGRATGFTNMNNIQRPEQGEIHLHMIDHSMRGKGYGRKLFMMSVKEYFNRHGLKKIICQPAAGNPGPNRLMAALGIPITRTYLTRPSQLCFEHEVNRYELTPAMLGDS